jgi:hypothetical protein
MERCSTVWLGRQATSPTCADAIAAAFKRAQSREAPMDKANALFLYPSTEHMWPTPEFNQACSDAKVRNPDERLARLLLVLHELDESVAGLEELPKTELSELVSSAILACGFVDPIEARYAIDAVLQAIEIDDSMPESS